MKFVSTRGQSPAVTFTQAVSRGLAPDGGLYVPEAAAFPNRTDWLRKSAREYTYAGFAAEWLAPFCSDIPFHELLGITHDAWQEFPADNPAPVRRLSDDVAVLELFHGPTLAFKDFALQFLGRIQARNARETGERITVLGATSGDTGAAAIRAVPAVAGTCVILYPNNRIAPLAELQMIAGVAKHTRALALDGDFDTCQAIVKRLMGDESVRNRHQLAAINSINIARILGQSVYYAWTCARLGEEAFRRGVRVVIPSGNFGNALAAEFARRCGAPIREIVAATNANGTLARFFESGIYAPAGTVATLAPAMDIAVPSNFERWLWLTSGGDSALVRDFFANPRSPEVSSRIAALNRAGFAGVVADDKTITRLIAEVYQKFSYTADPHTACAFATPMPAGGPIHLVAATAHPAKFPETMAAALGVTPTHPELERLRSLPHRKTVLPATAEAVMAFLNGTA